MNGYVGVKIRGRLTYYQEKCALVQNVSALLAHMQHAYNIIICMSSTGYQSGLLHCLAT